MLIKEKQNLLTRNVWSIKEVKNYFNLTSSKRAKISPKLTNRPPFSASVYRDDVFKLLNTSLENEAKALHIVGEN